MAYLLDANVFIEAKRHHYGLDFTPFEMLRPGTCAVRAGKRRSAAGTGKVDVREEAGA
jgi:hypothetical protein